jgi:hypothetical protein
MQPYSLLFAGGSDGHGCKITLGNFMDDVMKRLELNNFVGE